MWYDPIISAVLRTPLHRMLGDTMLITVTGLKSGKKYTTPVNYFREGDLLWIISKRERTWWRNLCGGACVTMLLDGRVAEGFAEAVLDEEIVAARLADYVRQNPAVAGPLGVRMEQGVANVEDAARLAKDRVCVKIKVQGR